MPAPSRRRPLLVAFGATALVGVTAVAFLALRSDEAVKTADDSSTAARPAQAATAVEVLTTESAVAAAVRYVASNGELFAHSPVGRREILRKLVTPEALPAQVAALDEVATAMSSKLSQPIEEYVWVEAPLTAGTEDGHDANDVTVAVWTVAVFAHPSGEMVEQVWRTVHVTLQATGGRWLVAEASSDSGPTPTANELALPSSVDDYLGVARLTPVVPHEEL